MKKQAESAFGRPPSFHHLLRIIVMMLLCLICATPQMSAKTIEVKFPHPDMVQVAPDYHTLTLDDVKFIFESQDKGDPTYKTVGVRFKLDPCYIYIETSATITGVTAVYEDGGVYIRNSVQLTSGIPKEYDPSRNLKKIALETQDKNYLTILKSIIINTLDEAVSSYVVKLVQPDEGGSIRLINTNAEDVSDITNIEKGTELTVVASPDDGYEIDRIYAIKNGNKEDITTSKEFTVDADTEITATFKKITYPVTLSEYQNGKVVVTDGNGTEIKNLSAIESGSKLTVTLTPEDGYTASLSSDVEGSVKETTTDESKGVKTYEVTVTQAINLTASFTLNSYPVTINSAGEGNIVVSAEGKTVSTGEYVAYDTELTIKPIAKYSYMLSSLFINNESITLTDQTYTHTVKEPVTISAAFVKDDVNFAELLFADSEQGTITVSPKDGTTTYNSGQRIAVNTALVVKAKPNRGYKLTAIKAGETSNEFNTTGEGTLECTATAGTFNISATFAEYKAYAVTWTEPKAAEGSMTVKNGDATITSGTTIENSTTLTVILKANDGYTPSLKVNNATVEPTSTENDGRAKTYSVKVTAPTTLTPEFTRNSYKVTIVGSNIGTVTVKAGETVIDNGSSVDYGTELTITPKPANGYYTGSLQINNVSVVLNKDGSYEMTVKEDVTIQANFNEDKPIVQTVAVTWSNTNPDGGSITVINGTTQIDSGSEVASSSKLTVTLTPKEGYTASLESDMGGSIKETTAGDFSR